jgi:hypothetical protein
MASIDSKEDGAACMHACMHIQTSCCSLITVTVNNRPLDVCWTSLQFVLYTHVDERDGTRQQLIDWQRSNILLNQDQDSCSWEGLQIIRLYKLLAICFFLYVYCKVWVYSNCIPIYIRIKSRLIKGMSDHYWATETRSDAKYKYSLPGSKSNQTQHGGLGLC